MNVRSQRILILCAGLCVAGLMVWPGCCTPPLPSKRTPIADRKKSDFSYPRRSPPTRTAVITQLGQPDAYLGDLRIACYEVNEVTRRHLWLLLFVIPVNVEKTPGYVDLAFLEFDQDDRLKRTGFVTTRKPRRSSELSKAAYAWHAEESKPKPAALPPKLK